MRRTRGAFLLLPKGFADVLADVSLAESSFQEGCVGAVGTVVVVDGKVGADDGGKGDRKC